MSADELLGLNAGDRHRLLLERAGRLFDRYEAGRVEPFNVFTVLRSAHDEVNLHSRFLTALLDYRQPPEGQRENLKDFLDEFSIDGIDHNEAKVEREADNIDILIRDRGTMRAVVIENKIWAADQDRQLQRYKEQMEDAGYEVLRILYLTPDRRDASEESAGELDYQRVSYKEDLLPWLKRCQQRACDEPPLRESVAQYLRLIGKLTGTDASEAYMMELKKLCLEKDSDDVSNLLLVHDLEKAAIEARIDLLVTLWKEIEAGLNGRLDLPNKSEDSDITEERIRRFVEYRRNYAYHGLYYSLGKKSMLSVEVENYIYFGLSCHIDESPDEYRQITDNFQDGRRSKGWPWFEYPQTDLNLNSPTREHLDILVDVAKRQKYVDEVVSGVSDVWKRIREAGLYG